MRQLVKLIDGSLLVEMSATEYERSRQVCSGGDWDCTEAAAVLRYAPDVLVRKLRAAWHGGLIDGSLGDLYKVADGVVHIPYLGITYRARLRQVLEADNERERVDCSADQGL